MISVGIDISKGKSKVCIVNQDGEILLSPHDVTHTREAMLKLAQQIHSFNEECKVVMGSNWPLSLSSCGFLKGK